MRPPTQPDAALVEIVAMTSPLPTAAPSATLSRSHLAGPMGDDLVLHLHRLDHADEVALGHLVTLGDGDFEDGALERRGQGGARGGGAAAAAALALRWLAASARGRGGAAGDGLADHLDVEELAGDLDFVVALSTSSFSSEEAGAGSGLSGQSV